MKLTPTLLLISSLAAMAATEEQLNQRFTVHPEGKLVVDVDFGAIDVTTHASDEVVVDVWRKITRRTKAEEERFLKDHPVTCSQEGGTVTVHLRARQSPDNRTRPRRLNQPNPPNHPIPQSANRPIESPDRPLARSLNNRPIINFQSLNGCPQRLRRWRSSSPSVQDTKTTA